LKDIAMAFEPTLYAIYDADGSVLGELRYLRDRCIGKAECALCDLTHGWNPMGRPAWRQRNGVTASLIWLHRDELPEHALHHLRGQLPCIAVDRDGDFDILISREALQGCEGDFNVFEHLLEQKVRALPSPIAAATEIGIGE
jgi:hypothetical protein